MTRTALLLLLIGTRALAQLSSPLTPVVFRTKWDVNDAPVRIRPASDSLGPWIIATAVRYSRDGFEIKPSRVRPLPPGLPTEWVVEARVPEAQLRDENG